MLASSEEYMMPRPAETRRHPPNKERHTFNVTLPVGLHDELVALAVKNRRSVNAETVHLIERHVKEPV
jgi:Arc-like DNA binding dprotein